jgi:hypothetical protein
MTSPPDSLKGPLLDCLYHGLLRFASLPPSKRAYGVHLEFFDASTPLAVIAYVNCPHPSVGAGFLYFNRDKAQTPQLLDSLYGFRELAQLL